MIISSKTPRSK